MEGQEDRIVFFYGENRQGDRLKPTHVRQANELHRIWGKTRSTHQNTVQSTTPTLHESVCLTAHPFFAYSPLYSVRNTRFEARYAVPISIGKGFFASLGALEKSVVTLDATRRYSVSGAELPVSRCDWMDGGMVPDIPAIRCGATRALIRSTTSTPTMN